MARQLASQDRGWPWSGGLEHITEFPLQVGYTNDRDRYSGQEYEHVGKSSMTRVLRCQQDRFTLQQVGDFGITGLSSSITRRGEMVSTGEGHPDLPLGFSGLLMVWGT